MAEEVSDVNAEITTDIFADEAESPAPEESSTEETKTEEVPEEGTPDEEAAVDSETDDKPAEGEPEPNADEAPKPRSAEARKESLQAEMRTLANQRNQLRDEVAALNAKYYRAPTAEEVYQQAQENGEEVSASDARMYAFEERQRLAEQNVKIADLNASLSVESLQVLNDFPMFNPDAPEYDATLANRAASVYQKVAGIQTDPQTGLITNANALPYDIYKAFAETHQTSAQSGQVNGQRAAEKMLAATDTPSSAAPKTPKVDPLVALWKD